MGNTNKTILGKPVLLNGKRVGIVFGLKEVKGIGIVTIHINKSVRRKICPMTIEIESSQLKNNIKNVKWSPNEK